MNFDELNFDVTGNTSDNYVESSPYTSYGYKGESGTFMDSMGNIFNSAGKMLTGGSGTGAQLASLAGLAGLAGAFGGGSGGGGFAGYRGGIPKYTASRTQYAPPVSTLGMGYRPSDTEIMDYLKRPGLNDSMIARSMNEYGVSPERIAGITGTPVANVQSRYQAALGPNAGIARRPGSGGVTYFSPMVYTPQAAAAPATPAPATPTVVEPEKYAGGGIASLGGYSDGGQLLRGPGDGVSDDIPATIGDKQPARLADGEFVVPARIVSELGNGSTEAGARKLYAMMDRIKKARSKSMKNIAANSKADKHLPA
jgi:hypothetical protein